MQDTGTAQFEGTDTIMSLGYAICSFHGNYYQVSDPHHQYLSLTTGEPVAIMVSSQDGGWIKGAVSPQGLWKTGVASNSAGYKFSPTALGGKCTSM